VEELPSGAVIAAAAAQRNEPNGDIGKLDELCGRVTTAMSRGAGDETNPSMIRSRGTSEARAAPAIQRTTRATKQTHLGRGVERGGGLRSGPEGACASGGDARRSARDLGEAEYRPGWPSPAATPGRQLRDGPQGRPSPGPRATRAHHRAGRVAFWEHADVSGRRGRDAPIRRSRVRLRRR
jgi:hypothetical protein